MAPTAAQVAKAMTPISASEKSPPVTHQQGFTLLELLLVLGILAMGAMLLGPGLATLDSPGFNAQTREATGLLNYARRMAVVQGTPATIEFQVVSANSNTSRSNTNNRTGHNPTGNDADEPHSDIVGRWRGENIDLGYRDSAGQEAPVDRFIHVTFYPEGGSTGGELVMRQDNRHLTINVDPFSGRVRVLNED